MTAPRLTPTRAAYVAAGGAMGATCRWAAFDAFGSVALDEISWSLLLVNVVGTAVLAWAITESRRRPDQSSLLVDGVGTGFCGGLTTFSTLAVRNAAQLRAGEVGAAALSITLTLAVGLTVAAVVVHQRAHLAEEAA